MDEASKLWLCRRCGRQLAAIKQGEPDPCMPPAQQVTAFPDRLVFVCECGCVQVWHKTAVDKDAHAV